MLYVNLLWKSQKKSGVAASNHSHQEYKKNTESISFHLSCSPFYIFLIVDFKGNIEPAEKFKPFSLFWSHSRPCLRAQVQQIPACCRSQSLIEIYDYITYLSAISSLLDKHLHYSRQLLICIFKMSYCRSKRTFQKTLFGSKGSFTFL